MRKAPGLGTACATVVVLTTTMLGVDYPEGFESIFTGALSVIFGFALHRFGVIQPGDLDEDGRVDVVDQDGEQLDVLHGEIVVDDNDLDI